MQSIDTAAVWRSPALVGPAVVGSSAVGGTRHYDAVAATAQSVGTCTDGRMTTQGEVTERNRMSHRSTVDNAAKYLAVAFVATPAAGYGNRPRGTPLS